MAPRSKIHRRPGGPGLDDPSVSNGTSPLMGSAPERDGAVRQRPKTSGKYFFPHSGHRPWLNTASEWSRM